MTPARYAISLIAPPAIFGIVLVGFYYVRKVFRFVIENGGAR
ncbi:hypothetical protein V1279_003024 [Bradyrhizobium sp. AZCC 1610]